MMDVKFTPPNLGPMIQRDLNKYGVEVGVLEDKPAAKWKKERKQYAGGPANKTAGKDRRATLSAILKEFDVVFNLLLGPWQKADNKDVVMTVGQMMADMSVKGSRRRQFLNAVQAVVRNPILRGDYGKNSREWARRKGFNRLFINTATLFKNIKARMK